MNVVAVIQARAGSTRFPGKVLADLGGRPMLGHVIERTARARSVSHVVVATSIDTRDDAVAQVAMCFGAAVMRGPEDDVLTRYVLAAHAHQARVVVRITADCPLVDPRLIDRVVGALRRHAADYASNVDPPSYPDGYDVEAFTTECLTRMDAEARFAYEREHVTPRAREHPELYRIAHVRCRRDLSHMRLTVDVPTDLERVAEILGLLPPRSSPGLGAVLACLARNPHLADTRDAPERDERYLAQRAVPAARWGEAPWN